MQPSALIMKYARVGLVPKKSVLEGEALTADVAASEHQTRCNQAIDRCLNVSFRERGRRLQQLEGEVAANYGSNLSDGLDWRELV